MLSGEKIRITLDNFCGHEKVILTKATAAKSLGGDKISAETIVPITFRGAVSTDIPAGEKAVSDAIELSVNRGEEIAVSLYFKDFTEMRSGVVITGPLSQGYFAVGDQTCRETLEVNTSKKTSVFYFLSDIEVLADKDCRTVICYGDSITAQAWPDYLMERVLMSGNNKTAVIKKSCQRNKNSPSVRQYNL